MLGRSYGQRADEPCLPCPYPVPDRRCAVQFVAVVPARLSKLSDLR